MWRDYSRKGGGDGAVMFFSSGKPALQLRQKPEREGMVLSALQLQQWRVATLSVMWVHLNETDAVTAGRTPCHVLDRA